MNIVIVCDILGKKNNGTSMASYNLINHLKSKGHNVKVLCCDNDDSEDQDGFVLLDKLNLGPLNSIIRRNGVSLPLKNKQLMTKTIQDCDIVHIMLPFQVGICACKIAKKLGKPVTAGFHCQAELVSSHIGLMNIDIVNKLIYKSFYNNLYQFCDAIHYPTQFICETFENLVGCTNHYIISNGVNKYMTHKNCHKPKELKDKFIILSTGRLCKEKSHITLLKAIKQSKYNKQIQLIIAGVGPLQKKLEGFAKHSLENMPIIKYFSRDEMVSLINYADLYVHPAEVELEGIACLEAVNCGLVPIVSNSNKSATKNLAISEHNLFDSKNPSDLAQKIDFWIEHPREKQKSKKEYLKLSKKYDQEDCMDKMENMFLTILENRL